jgi:acyl dehydratase
MVYIHCYSITADSFNRDTHAAPTLPNGLSLISFEVQANKPVLVGDKVDVQFTLKNLEPKPIMILQGCS